MIPFAMIVGDKLRDRLSKVAVAERNQAVETFLFDRAHEAFGVGVRIRRPIRRLETRSPPPQPARTGALHFASRSQISTRYTAVGHVRVRATWHMNSSSGLASTRGSGPAARPDQSEDRVERDQATPRPDFGREEIGPGDLASAPAGTSATTSAAPARAGSRAPSGSVQSLTADAVPEVLQRALDPRVAPRRILLGHPPTSCRISARTPRRLAPFLAYVHLRAMSCRCQRSSVSGVTIVATSRSADGPAGTRARQVAGGRHR